MSKLILGTVQFGLNYGINNTQGKPALEKVFAILDHAFANGITILDTAVDYGDAMQVIGDYHQQSSNRFNVISKFKQSPEFNLTESVRDSLRILDTNSLEGLLYHSFDNFVAAPELWEELTHLKEQGLIKKIGVSIYSNQQLEYLTNSQRQIDIVQLPYNLLDNLAVRGKQIKLAAKKGIEIHTRSVFLQGLFFKPISDLSLKMKPLKPYLQKISSISKESNVPINQLALCYPNDNEDINHTLIGVDSIEQLMSNLEAIKDLKLDEYVLKSIDAIEVKEQNLLQPINW